MTGSRSSGILLHPTSFPSMWGIGDLGAPATAFIDFLVAAGQQIWQVMPLGPTGYGDSPYQSFSAFAGNTNLISPDRLLTEGLLTPEDLADAPVFGSGNVDYGAVIPFKQELLRRSFARFRAGASNTQHLALETFRSANAAWLNDYALFAALKDANGGAPWNTWDPALAFREPAAIATITTTLADEVLFHSYAQWLFFQQWLELKAYANRQGVRIVGDAPIFVAYDSADVWGNRAIFELDEAGDPTAVAGVPPDYFSATGQLWGNPLYRWDALEQRGYDWWIARFQAIFTLVDILRLDHFRGFAGYWSVPAGEVTAINGQWLPGPGATLFEAVERVLGTLPIIAEDLGVITPDVDALRLQFGFPGMKVLHFAFGGGADQPYLPHNYDTRTVVYTGTHDNDTTRGWWEQASSEIREHVQLYLGRDGHDISWDLIRLAFASVAETAIVPLQDVLALGSEARMNTPGVAGGNWGWRYTPDMLTDAIAERLRLLTQLYGRLPQNDEAGDATE
ncbi:MAG TPA: 4-alpha-glucanotransferase [Roseiflexaceae bacterium]|nr:4-alpha-glucanotransferase [Roseiflexaceae bacterium]HMP40365.1 4-alpha-glucanotransferase [Roseiflexaceae bacterium]